MIRRLFLILSLTLVVCLFVYQYDVTGQNVADDFDLQRIESATVFIMQARSTTDDFFITCVSTGTIVSRGGLILTNAHSVLQSASCPGDTIIIALSIRPDEPPVPKYRAEIAQSN